MQGKNHVALALAAPLAGALLVGTPLPASALAWGGLVLGSLAPDIDGEGSIARWGDWLPRSVTPRPLVRLLNWAGRTVSSFVRAVFGHRAAFHWPLWGVALGLAGWSLGHDWLLWFGVGYILHILGDALTVAGVPLLGPLLLRDFSLLPMRTGGRVEAVIGAGLWLFVGWQLVIGYW